MITDTSYFQEKELHVTAELQLAAGVYTRVFKLACIPRLWVTRFSESYQSGW